MAIPVSELQKIAPSSVIERFELQLVTALHGSSTVYRSTECSYTGSNYWNASDQSVATLALDVCGKRLDSCKLRFGSTGSLPFGSFPGIGAFTS